MRSSIAPFLLAAVAAMAAPGCDSRLPAGPAPDPVAVETIRARLFVPGQGDAAAGPVIVFKHDEGYATLRGRFKLAGAAPGRAPLTVAKDAAVCAPGGKAVLSERLMVDESTGGIANVVVYVVTEKNRPIPVHESAAKPREGAPAVLDNKNCLFVPHMLAVHRGIGTLTI
ncbi:MAG: hypothetical protein WD176_07575, partial [Pirellulales bacterium]